MDGVDTLQQQDRDRAIALVLASVYVCLWTMTRVARGNGPRATHVDTVPQPHLHY